MVKTMNFGNVMVLAIAVVAVSTILHTTEAAEYVVGDDLGWTVPPGGAASYASWAAKYRFVVNDILYFNFTEGEHTVALVTKENYEICNTTDPLFKLDGPSGLQFLSSDTFYFTCTFTGHCAGGQKVEVYIASSASTPSPSPVVAPPPAASLPFTFVSKKLGFRKV
ncbi:mavicyanin-like [Pyrus x bretschneideri]|uniref:mavicyanin-like n=1 Tax=Pyrus x bretschneideri TaxID=225117 RepID=UPI000870A787|nr:mavicyanin-like [Pyrus x bretschneideri]